MKMADLKHGSPTKSDGSLVTREDIALNDLADRLAKKAVEAHRVPQGEIEAWKAKMAEVKERAMWIGVATFEANSSKTFPFTDSESSRWKADAARRRREEAKKGIDGRRTRKRKASRATLKPEDGGHTVVRATGCRGWICSVCRVASMVKAKLETQP